MPKEEKKYRAYFSHQIRGKKGDKATDEDMQQNCLKAVEYGEMIESYLLDWHRMEGMPLMDLHIPGRGDEFVQIAYRLGILTEKEILTVDCMILDRCDLLIVMGSELSSGMKVEIEYADSVGIPILKLRGKGSDLTKGEKLALTAALDFIMD